MKKRGMWVMGMILAGWAFVAPVQANVVTNGGFEAEDFTGWTQTGDTTFNFVVCPGPDPSVFEGNCSGWFGPFSTGGIEQTIDIGSAGQTWYLSFAFQPDGGNPSSFAVRFGGQTLLSLVNPPADDYTVYNFSGVTTAANMTLAFDFVDQVGFLFLDGVSLRVPEPATLGLVGAGLAGLFFSRRRKTA